MMKKNFIFSLVLSAFAAQAQVAIDLSGSNVRVQTGGAKGTSIATNTEGTISSDVEMEGIAIINGQVFIDGIKIPRGKISYTSKKSGKNYTIQSDKDGNVSVQEK